MGQHLAGPPRGLIYAGKVDHGFDKKSAADLRKRLTPLIRETRPYSRCTSRHLGGAAASCRDRVPRQVRRREGAAFSPSGGGLSALLKPRLRRVFTLTGFHPFCNPIPGVKPEDAQ
jgi:hypothetical protein